MTRVLVSIPTARAVRFFLETPLFQELLTLDAEVSVMHGYETVAPFLERGRASERRYPALPRAKGIHAVLRNLSGITGMLRDYHRDGFVYLRNVFAGSPSRGRRCALWLMVGVAAILFSIPVFGRWLRRRIYMEPNIERLLRDAKPDCIVLTQPSVVRERVLAQVASSLQIPLIVTTHGWDTLTIHEHWLRYAGIAVWGEAMAAHARYLGYPDDRLAFTGVPYAEPLRAHAAAVDHAAARARWGIAPDDKVVVMFISSQIWTGEVCSLTTRMFVEAVESGRLPPAKLLLRLPPRLKPAPDEAYYLETYKDHPLVRVQVPSLSFVESEAAPPEKNIFGEVAEILAIADVVTSQLSMSLIEGALLGARPLLLAYEDVFYPTRHVLRTTIFKSFQDAAVPTVFRSTDFVDQLARCLASPPGASSLLEMWNIRQPGSFARLVAKMTGAKMIDAKRAEPS